MIKLNDTFHITMDKDQYMICRRVWRQEKHRITKEKVRVSELRPEKYFGKLDNLLSYLPEFMARQEKHKSLRELRVSIDQWRARLEKELGDE